MDLKDGNDSTNTLNVKRPRLQLPKKLKIDVKPSNDVIHHYCNALLESWKQPTTREHSYQILSFDNFHRLFSKTWKTLLRHNRPPRKVHTFTLAFETDTFIVLNYSGGYRIERFLLLAEPLIQFLTKLHHKYNKEARNDDNNVLLHLPLTVSINRDLISTETIFKVEENIENLYGITYGPSIQQLFECYVLPEIEQPCTLLGHALGVSNIESQSTTGGNNALYSRFIRTNETEDGSETESCPDDVEDEIMQAIGSSVEMEEERLRTCKTPTLKQSPNVYGETPKALNTARISSPIEADMASFVKSTISLPTLKQNSSQNSSKYNSKGNNPNSNTSNIVDNNQSELNSSENNESHSAAKIVLCAEVDATLSHPDIELEQQETDVIDVCCGLDSRYCKCYTMKGYIPKKIFNEIVQIEFISTGKKIWRMLIAKFTYNKEYEDIYKTGNLKAEHVTKNKSERIPFTEFIQKYNNDLFHTKFAMSVPCKLYQKWVNQQHIMIDKDVVSLTMIKLEQRCLLLTMNVLSHVFTDFQESEFSMILQKTFVYVENSNLPLMELSPEGNMPTDNRHYENGRLDVTNIVVEPDISSYYSTETRDPEVISANIPTQSFAKPIQTVSIGIQCDIPDIPFQIICLADIRSKIITNPPITGDFLFKHGFETSLEGDYAIRANFLASGCQHTTPRYDVKVLSDLSVCMILKDNSQTVNPLAEGLDLNYINRVDKLFNDTLEWESEAVQGVALPFYFKKLKPAYIKTENDFPSTLVAKKKIKGLIGESMYYQCEKGLANIPVLWISTRNLELSMIRHRLTSDHVFPLFKKSTNLKYSIDSIYFPNSVSSHKVYNTKFGTFDTLPMELQQTSKVFLKLSDYPKPFLLIISDAYVFNSKLVQQCEALLQFEKAKQVQVDLTEGNRDYHIRANAIKPPNFYNEIEKARQVREDFPGGSRGYHIRTNAIKPPNFYNENKSRVSGSYNQYEWIQSPFTVEYPLDKQSEIPLSTPEQSADIETPLIEEVQMDELQIDESIQLDREANVAPATYSQNYSVGPNDVIINQNINNDEQPERRSDTETPLLDEVQMDELQIEESIRVQLDTEVNVAPATYSQSDTVGPNDVIINLDINNDEQPEKEIILDANTATMTAEEKHEQTINDVKKSTLVRKSLPLQKKYSIIQERNREIRRNTDKMFLKRTYTGLLEKRNLYCVKPSKNGYKVVPLYRNKNNGTSTDKIETNIESVKTTNKESRNYNSTTNPPAIKTQIVNNESGCDRLNFIRRPNKLHPRFARKPISAKLMSHKKKLDNRNQVTYDDVLTPARIDEESYNFDLGKTKNKYFATMISKAEPLKVLDSDSSKNKHNIGDVLANTETTNQERNDHSIKDISLCSETANQKRNGEMNEKGNATFETLNNSHEIQNVNDRSKTRNAMLVSDKCDARIETDSSKVGKCFTQSTIMQSSDPLLVTSSQEKPTPNEEFLQSLTLPQLMLSYPMMNSTENINDSHHMIYRKVLNEKVKESIQQYRLAQKPAMNKLNTTRMDRDISVDIKVSLNSKNQVDGLPQIGPPVVRTQNTINQAISTSRQTPALKRRNNELAAAKGRTTRAKLVHRIPVIDSTNIQEAARYMQDMRVPNRIIPNGNSKSMSTSENNTEYSAQQTARHMSIMACRQNSSLSKQNFSQYPPTSQRIDASPQFISTRRPTMAFLPQSTVVQSTTNPYREIVDNKGNTVSSEPRYQSACCCSVPTIQTPPFQSARPDVLRFRVPPRTVPQHATRFPIPLDHMQMVPSSPYFQRTERSMPFMHLYHQTIPQHRWNADSDTSLHPQIAPPQSFYFSASNHDRPALPLPHLQQIPSRYSAMDPRLISSGNFVDHNGRMQAHHSFERIDTSSTPNPVPSSYSMNFTNALGMQSINIDRSSSDRDPDLNQQRLQQMVERNNEIRSNYASMVHSVTYNYSPKRFSSV